MGRPKLNKCSHCGTTFTTRYSLDRHIKERCKNIVVLSDATLSNTAESKKPSAVHDIIEAYKLGMNFCGLSGTKNIKQGLINKVR